jgi:hypothetical protein
VKGNFKVNSCLLFHILLELESLTLQEESRLIALANRAPKKTFGHKRMKVEKVGKKTA